MKVVVIAIGQKLPDWANTACEDYLRRFPKRLERRSQSPKSRRQKYQNNGKNHAGRGRKNSVRDSQELRFGYSRRKGSRSTSVKLASKLNSWNDQGRTVVFVIGGADGLDKHLKAEGELMLRLSSLTLPHAMVRVLILEQIYRSWSLLHNHPYHRA